MSEKINFDVDWNDLFPGKPFTIGSLTHNITPLNISEIAAITKKIKAILPMIKAEGITLENINNPEKIVKIIPIIMDNCPEIISDATNITLESIAKFKPEYLLKLVTIVVEVNMESKDALEKNFKSLIETFQNQKNVEKVE